MEKVKKLWADHKVAIITGLWRIGRSSVALAVSLVVAEVANDPQWVWLAPALLGLDKFIRTWSNK